MELKELNEQLRQKPVVEQLRTVSDFYRDKIVFTTSFGMEDQVLTDMIFKNDIPVKVVTLDTGRLFPETYKVFHDTITKYDKKIHVFFPERDEVEEMVTKKGPFSFYDSKENRLECCHIRKVVPLDRALDGMHFWISGIRSGQSFNRKNMSSLEWDEGRKLFKFYPLMDWSVEDVDLYIKENNIPSNTLYTKGFKSIGCAPCTRAVRKGEDLRAGRWWWENDSIKECGCHIK